MIILLLFKVLVHPKCKNFCGTKCEILGRMTASVTIRFICVGKKADMKVNGD